MSLNAVTSLRQYVNTLASIRRQGKIPSSFTDENVKIEADPESSLRDSNGLEHMFLDFININKEHKLKGKVGGCYKYAYRASCDYDNLIYCEGYAVGRGLGIPLMHAWCVDKNTHQVYDPTWKNKNAGESYCGLPLSTRFIHAVMIQSELYGVLDNLWYVTKKLNNFKLNEIVHKDFHDLVFAKSI
jgi:hypothetical protein